VDLNNIIFLAAYVVPVERQKRAAKTQKCRDLVIDGSVAVKAPNTVQENSKGVPQSEESRTLLCSLNSVINLCHATLLEVSYFCKYKPQITQFKIIGRHRMF
jgi:hypothetical protein